MDAAVVHVKFSFDPPAAGTKGVHAVDAEGAGHHGEEANYNSSETAEVLFAKERINVDDHSCGKYESIYACNNQKSFRRFEQHGTGARPACAGDAVDQRTATVSGRR